MWPGQRHVARFGAPCKSTRGRPGHASYSSQHRRENIVAAQDPTMTLMHVTIRGEGAAGRRPALPPPSALRDGSSRLAPRSPPTTTAAPEQCSCSCREPLSWLTPQLQEPLDLPPYLIFSESPVAAPPASGRPHERRHKPARVGRCPPRPRCSGAGKSSKPCKIPQQSVNTRGGLGGLWEACVVLL